ncbi:S8 family serine peptidase [Pyxidicoccus xibeiensis]|uniref:S8 family serine peptidase n=1 Tax=Pyxidicoccus xibeiensis TaxID=2906759 RepID=UPI0020A7DE0C|nr:S8 family serine peptidase [Pyxidicoccus xibeiensis]MCP3143064.1 S8 family serine peptidase [Pyxidicoccus xibeiensis]
MKRWGLVGLMALAACAPEDTAYTGAQGGACPGVTAGALMDEPQEQDVRGGPREDGRQSFIVRFRKDGVSAASQVGQLGGQVTARYRTVPAVAARLTADEHRKLAQDPRVESIEPDQVWHALGMATLPARAFAAAAVEGSVTGEYTDSLLQVQANTVWDPAGAGVPDTARPTGRGVRVCIIDSGLDLEHPELEGAVVARRDFLDGDDVPSDGVFGAWGSGHGTHVAGIVAARPGRGAASSSFLEKGGLVGVAPEAELVIARVLDVNGRTEMSLVLQALEFCAAEGARVASLSLGGGFATRTTLQAFQAAADSGMLVVAASGNDGGRVVSYPASDPSVLAVGAVDAQNRRAVFSSGGDGMGLVAPGVDVLSTFPQGHGAFSTLEARDLKLLSRPLLNAPEGTRTLGLVDCGEGETLDSCKKSSCSGFIAYVRPSYLPVDLVMINVMMQGAKAVIFGNEAMEGAVDILSLPRKGRWVPAITVNQAGSSVLHRLMSYSVRVEVKKADYAYMSGTSMAAPYVSGVAALLFSAHPSATAEQVRTAMLSTARDLGSGGYDEEYGHGLVQAHEAMEALEHLP